MPDQANVKSSDAIEASRAAVLMFAKQAEDGLTELDLEMRRMVDWLEHDRPGFWTEQVRLAYDRVGQAKADLHRCLMFPVGVNDRPSCSEERAALKKAEAHLAYCQQKQEKLKHWVREVRHELHSYEGRTTQLRELIETDAPRAAATLAKLLLQLEEYARGASPGVPVRSKSTEESTEEPGHEGTNSGPANDS